MLLELVRSVNIVEYEYDNSFINYGVIPHRFF